MTHRTRALLAMILLALPAAAAADTLVTGLGAGALPQISVFDSATAAQLSAFFAYDTAFAGGVRVAAGDVNGDGVPDVVTGTGPGTVANVKVFDGATGGAIKSFLPFGASFTGGVYVAAGDFNNDGHADIVVGADAGGASHVKAFDGASGAEFRSFFAYGSGFTGGVRVAVGDVNGDKTLDIVTGAGPGASPHVKAFDGVTGAEIRSFFAFDAGFAGGVFVAAGDFNGDGAADLVVGADAGGGPHVKVFDGATGAEIRSFFAYDPAFRGGVRVAAGDVTGDGTADIITGAGPGGGPHVKVFDGGSLAPLLSFFAASPSFLGGVYVATAGDFQPPDPGAMLSTLIETVAALEFQPGLNLLHSALSNFNAGNLGDACDQVNAFVKKVRAQTGKVLTSAEANQLLQAAAEIQQALGCIAAAALAPDNNLGVYDQTLLPDTLPVSVTVRARATARLASAADGKDC